VAGNNWASSLTRRTLVKAGSLSPLATLSACYPMQSAWAFKRYYRYTVLLEVDGQSFEASNGGVFTGSRGWAGGGGYIHDFTMPWAKRLSSGEVLLVLPPHIQLAVDRAQPKAKQYELITSAPYLAHQIPSIFPHFHASVPRSVEAYIMPAAQTGNGTRVKVLSVENELTQEDQRMPIDDVLPWFRPAAALIEARLRRGVEGYWASLEDIRAEYPAEVVQNGAFKGLLKPQLFAWIATITRRVEARTRPPSGTTGTRLEAAVDAVGRDESIHIPLMRSGAKPNELQWPEDSRIVEFATISEADVAWAEAESYPTQQRPSGPLRFAHLLSLSFAAPALGATTFVKQAAKSATWISADGDLELAVNAAWLNLAENKVLGYAGSGCVSSHCLSI